MSPGWRLVRQIAARSRLALAVGLVTLLAVDLGQLVVPRFIKYAVDDLTTGRATPHTLLLQAGGIVGLGFAIAALRMVWRPLLLGFSRRVERDLRLRIFDHVQSLHVGYLDQHPPGEIMARATNDLNSIRMASGIGLVAAADGILLSSAAVGFMLYISPLLTLLAVLPMPVIMIITRIISRRLHRRFQQTQASFSAMTELVREALAGIRLVKAFGLAGREERRLETAAQRHLVLNMSLARLMGLLFPLTVLVTNLSLAAVLGVGGPLTVLGEITAGDFVAFTAYLALLTWPMMALGWVISLSQQARSGMERIDQILLAQPAITDPDRPRPLPRAEALGIEARDLSFTYPGAEAPALRGVNLTIAAGRTTALAGRVGSGKSTLLALLGRLYDPPPGSLLVGGVDVRQVRQAELRAALVQVPQDAFLFSATVRENLTLGNPAADDQALWAALAAARLDQDVAALDQGLDSELGERAHTLSGGQRQRLSLARALLLDPPVLILDDPLSAVDTETEAAILANLAELRAGRTTLLVSHRLASVAFAQRIYVLDRGRVVESGSHQELVSAGGLYQALFAEQELLAQLTR